MVRMNRWMPLLALGLAACGGLRGEEPLYVLRDSMGRSVALAGSTQLGEAAPGTMIRANLGGVEQELMVGERVGRGPVLAARPAAMPELPPVASTPLVAPAMAEEPPPAPPPRRASRRRAAPAEPAM